MIIEVTHEGDGVFKIWPAPNGADIPSLRDYLMAYDPSNKEARGRVGLFDEEEVEEAREAANDAEAKASSLEEVLEEVKTIAENADEKDAEEMQKAIGEIIKAAHDALY